MSDLQTLAPVDVYVRLLDRAQSAGHGGRIYFDSAEEREAYAHIERVAEAIAQRDKAASTSPSWDEQVLVK